VNELHLELPRELDSAATARHAIDGIRELPDDQLGDVRLLVSELVTNSLRHAGLAAEDRIVLVVHVDGERTRVEVSDTGSGFAFPGEATDPETVDGWGLYLVATLADRWGVDREGSNGATVWFELDRSPDVSGARAA
jgi:anti-sigma regulatory factor (Ser/Thr protein kinase)